MLIKGRATQEGTAAYRRRFVELADNFRVVQGFSTSSLGVGTYLGEADGATDRVYEQALSAALRCGLNFIDTAVNYRFQRSERAVGRTLAALISTAEVSRDEILIATKGGYPAFDGEMPADPRRWFEERYVRPGIIGEGDLIDGHCMAPRYLDTMIETSRANLGLETIDIYYLHNPEAQLSRLDRSAFLTRMRLAFELLETKAREGKIGVYGTATWNGYRVEPHDRFYLSLSELEGIAREVGGPGHRFRAIQLPYNLAMTEAVAAQNQVLANETGSVVRVASALGIDVFASAPLLQGRLARGLPPFIAEVLGGLSSDAQRAVQFVRSTPGIGVALVGIKSITHLDEIVELARRPPAPPEQFAKLFRQSQS